jgi:hypothetical protein
MGITIPLKLFFIFALQRHMKVRNQSSLPQAVLPTIYARQTGSTVPLFGVNQSTLQGIISLQCFPSRLNRVGRKVHSALPFDKASAVVQMDPPVKVKN